MNTVVKIPILRFPEFKGEWEEQKLKKLTTKIGSGSTPRGGRRVYTSEGILFIRSQNVNRNRLIFEDVIYISEEKNLAMKNSIVKPLDILLNITGASIGRSCVVPSDFKVGNVNQHVCIVRLNNDNEPYFLQPFLASSKGQKLIYQGQTGSGREGINFPSIANFKIALPSRLEQNKIALFLRSIDTIIERLTRQQKLMKQYKKGVMQRMFSQEIRFKADNGSAFPEWKEKKIGAIFEQRTEKFIDGLELLSVTMNNGVKKRSELEGKDNSSNDKSNYKRVYKNDIVYNSMRMWQGANGVSSYDGVVSPAYTVLKSNDENDSKYFGYLFKTREMTHIFQRNSQGLTSDTWNLKYPQLSTIKLIVPSLLEQKKITSFLAKIDTKIEQVSKQVNSTREFKKALLQQMFV